MRTSAICIIAALAIGTGASAQDTYTNPVVNYRDGAVERFGGYFYGMGQGQAGRIFRSKDLVHWDSGTLAVTTGGATWLNDSKWTQAYTYKQVGAGDLVYLNGVWHCYFNGIGHAYSATPLGPYTEQSLTAPFDDYGIDVQVFRDEDGSLWYVKKRNPDDPDPMTGAASNLKGPQVWTFRMNSPFSRWDITEGRMQLEQQPGHPTSLNHVNFEGPELARYRDKYYMFYAVNRMGPRSGMYEVGGAMAISPMGFSNASKFPQPVMVRNTERMLLEYNVLAPTAEHGGWDAAYTFQSPDGDWQSLSYDDSAWQHGKGGFGAKYYDWFGNQYVTNAVIRARKTAWTSGKLYVRRTFNVDTLPSHAGLKLWLNGSATISLNGHSRTFKSASNTYTAVTLDPSWLTAGENILAAEVTSSDTTSTSQQFFDCGVYDTGDSEMESVLIGPSQTNFIAGPNGFERWMAYKAYVNATEKQCIDRVYFYGDEPVVQCTAPNTPGLHPAPALPTATNYMARNDTAMFVFLDGSSWKVSSNTLKPVTDGGSLLFNMPAGTNYRLETTLRLTDASGNGGILAWYGDRDNWLSFTVGRDGTWTTTDCVDGSESTETRPLPTTFSFLDGNSLVSGYSEPYHTLTVYKNGGTFRTYLDNILLTDSLGMSTVHAGAGQTGLCASSKGAEFGSVIYTSGWDEYGSNITGWKRLSGSWAADSAGLRQDEGNGLSLAVKGDGMWNYEFSTDVVTDGLRPAGKAGFYPVYCDSANYVSAMVDYATDKMLVTEVRDGSPVRNLSLDLSNKVRRQYRFSPGSSYPTNTYIYDLRHEARVSAVDILWLEGEYPYLDQTFALPVRTYLLAQIGGTWKRLDYTVDGDMALGKYNRLSFDPVTCTALRVVVTNQSGCYARPFDIYVHEDVSSGYALRCRRENGKLWIFANGKQVTSLEGSWGKSGVAIGTEGTAARFSDFLCYQSGQVKVTDITVSGQDCQLGDSTLLTATVLPANATNTNVMWSSSDPGIASVSQDGVITRHREGEVVITARACDGTYRKGEITLGSANGIASVEGEARKGGSYVYGLDGKRVCPSARLSSLPRGIYILDDRKIVKN